MLRMAWMTDIHLNFLGTEQIEAWLNDVKREDFDTLVITGDIGEADSLYDYLVRISEQLNMPIYFVLGNHDYYRSSIKQVRAHIQHLNDEYDLLNWLPLHGVIKLTETTALIGHGAWGDGGYGDFMASSLMLNDYVLIQDLANISPLTRQMKLRALGQEAALYIERTLPKALDRFQQVYVALHVPPFQESCWHDGNTPPDDDDYLPHFTCKAVGDVLLNIASNYPERQITVLCGHTHGWGETTMRPNLHVITEGAIYGQPTIARIFTL